MSPARPAGLPPRALATASRALAAIRRALGAAVPRAGRAPRAPQPGFAALLARALAEDEGVVVRLSAFRDARRWPAESAPRASNHRFHSSHSQE